MKSMLVSKGGCILRIQSILNNLKSAEHRVANYILDHAELVTAQTMEELAVASDASYSTVDRLCRKLGYTGFREFKASLIYDVINNNNVGTIIQNLTVGQETSTQGIAENVYNLAFKVLEDSLAIMNISEIEMVVQQMIKAKKLCFIGAGSSGLCARYAYSRFFRIGLNCASDIDSTLYKMQAALLTEDDLLFVISSSGRTENVVEAARLAKKNGVTVVGLSDYAITPLSKTCDYNLYTTSRNANMFLNIDMPLITGQITIIDLLYMCTCVALGEDASRHYEKTITTANQEKTRNG
ncbi:MurR/RpiR family transcriptional regulator [Cohnella rhizosphaerae]|uniref:MurR/RpiR family transcriptional regulator n=1 Tax=Cohnella rhizosphaerae TaxID=1457232 RepID=A0A9X4QW18_9BACL|nr:MurR/RpiR family transcriptional regulator [Cohnella rhizosphaerae]MDG0813941.1 MurR/RpiR family transcriptional regulator [Cohnella rhizosphaerae]